MWSGSVSKSRNPFFPKGKEPKIEGRAPKDLPALLTKFVQLRLWLAKESKNGVNPGYSASSPEKSLPNPSTTIITMFGFVGFRFRYLPNMSSVLLLSLSKG